MTHSTDDIQGKFLHIPYDWRMPTLRGESREQAMDRMAEQAHGLGADAVVAVRFTTSMLMSGAAELLACGTAVVLEEAG